jgi:hypothetical protein
LEVSLAQLPTFAIAPEADGGIASTWYFDFGFSVTPAGETTPVPAFAVQAICNITLALGVAPTSFAITGDLAYLGADFIAGNSTVGPESGITLSIFDCKCTVNWFLATQELIITGNFYGQMYLAVRNEPSLCWFFSPRSFCNLCFLCRNFSPCLFSAPVPVLNFFLSLSTALVSFVLADVVLPLINKPLSTGIPLPTFPGLSFQNSVITLEAGYALVGLDFQFTPTAEE